MGIEDTPASSDTADKPGEYIFHKAGVEPKSVNDVLYYYESDERGNVFFRLSSSDSLEEDLSQMEVGDTLLGSEVHERLSTEAIKDTVKLLGEYLPKESLNSLLPRINLDKLDEYDFSSAKIKIFVLHEDTYNVVYSALNSSRDSKGSCGFTKMTLSSDDGYTSDKEVEINMSERRVAVVKEVGDALKESVRPGSKKLDISELSDLDIRIIETNLKVAMIHEIIHDFDVASDLRWPFREAITEWYAQQVIRTTLDSEDSDVERRIGIGYKNESTGLSILMAAALEGGIPHETIDRALLSADKKARKDLSDFWVERYGEESAQKITGWEFDSPRKSLDYIIGLESKKESKIGEFLKSYEIGF